MTRDSMTHTQFMQAVRQIAQRWPWPNDSSDTRGDYLERLWTRCRHLPLTTFNSAIERLLGNFARPTVDSIAAVAGVRHEGTYKPTEIVPKDQRADPEKLRAWREETFGKNGCKVKGFRLHSETPKPPDETTWRETAEYAERVRAAMGEYTRKKTRSR